MARNIVITGGKGGVGKTSVVAGLGVALARKGQRVCVLDGDVGLNNLDVTLGTEGRIVYDVTDVVTNRCRARQALVEVSDCTGLFVLPSIKGEREAKEYIEHNQKLAQYAIDASANFQEAKIGKLQIIGKNYPGVTKANAKVTIDIPIFAISMGDVAFVTAPYEMFCESGKEIKENSPFKTTFVATCANNGLSYMPTKATFHYNGEMAYEVKCTKFAEGTAELLVAEYITMLNELYKADA